MPGRAPRETVHPAFRALLLSRLDTSLYCFVIILSEYLNRILNKPTDKVLTEQAMRSSQLSRRALGDMDALSQQSLLSSLLCAPSRLLPATLCMLVRADKHCTAVL